MLNISRGPTSSNFLKIFFLFGYYIFQPSIFYGQCLWAQILGLAYIITRKPKECIWSVTAMDWGR